MMAETGDRAVITAAEDGDIIVLTVAGELCLGNVRAIEQILDDQISRSPGVIALDCAMLEFIDSSAIGTLVKFHNLSLHKGTLLILVGLSSSIVKLLETAKLDRIFCLMTKDAFTGKYLNDAGSSAELDPQFS